MPYTIQGQPVAITHEPQLKDGTLWVPFRALGEALGGRVDWDPDGKIAILYLGPSITTVKIGDQTVNTDGEDIELQAAPYLADGDTWIPVRFFSKPLGYNINVDLQTNKVDIVNPNG
jgi:hypothetical protein